MRPPRPLVALLACLAATACSAVDVPQALPGPTTTPSFPPQSEVGAAAGIVGIDCAQPEEQRPDGGIGADPPGDSYMAEIRDRGRLRVGVDIATLQLGSVNPISGDFEGFDIDVAKAVAAALFDEPEPGTDVIEYVGIRSANRVSMLVDGRVDLVASAFTINCARLDDIDFSAPYFVAGQKVLVRADDDAQSIEDLAGRTICVSEGSTAIANIGERSPEAIVETAPERGDCLVRLQQGQVDALATDDAILAGMAVQDPNLEVRGDPFSDEPYGLGMPANRPEWVGYVNAVLEDLHSSGDLQQLYDEWLADSLGPETLPPPSWTG